MFKVEVYFATVLKKDKAYLFLAGYMALIFERIKICVPNILPWGVLFPRFNAISQVSWVILHQNNNFLALFYSSVCFKVNSCFSILVVHTCSEHFEMSGLFLLKAFDEENNILPE